MTDLNSYPIRNLDPSTVGLLRKCIRTPARHKSDTANILVNLLDYYLGLTQQKISFRSLSTPTTHDALHGFVGAIWSDGFLQISGVTRNSYERAFRRAMAAVSVQVHGFHWDIDRDVADRIWQNLSICELQREYYAGWTIHGKSGAAGRQLKLAWIWNNLGPEIARKIQRRANDYAQGYRTKSLVNFVPVLNEFVAYLEFEYADSRKFELASSMFTTRLIDGFCSAFFRDKSKKGKCIETSIKRWNDAIDFMEEVLVGSGVFAKPHRKFPYVPPKRKSGSESRVVENTKGTIVKDSLVVEVPLDASDDAAIELIFQRLNEDVEIILMWAQEQVDDLYGRFVSNGHRFDCMDFDLSSAQLPSKYGVRTKKGEKLSDLAFTLGLPTSYSLDPFVYLLMKEDPRITEAFLLQLELTDKHGKLVGVECSDAGEYLVGYKRRRGGTRAQQKIRLSNKGRKLVSQLIEITTPLRSFLKAQDDPDFRYLFLSCRRGFSRPKRIAACLSASKQSRAGQHRIAEFVEVCRKSRRKGQWTHDKLQDLVFRLSPTRFRATCGIQVFLETGSAKAMSEALGHARYKPSLLEHYLPEPILRFFQARWVRIFQKGIVCEAMKESPLLLRASNFRTMKELDSFLSTHALALPSDSGAGDTDHQEPPDQAYISVDENVLTALLSIELAVANTERQVSPKAHFWSRFATCVKTEIQKNSFDQAMASALRVAESRARASLMDHLIHA